MKLVIGVTGGIGSGKTAVTDFFAARGITIVDADLAARVVVEPGQPALQTIAQHFDDDILLSDGSLNRRKLRNIIFQNDSEKLWLENLLHPLIRQQIFHELEQATSAYTILVSPLMIETDQKNLVNRLLVVDVPVDIQVARTTRRDHMTMEQTRAIIASQSTREEKLEQADDVVDNSGTVEALYSQLEKLHRVYLEEALGQRELKKEKRT